MMPSSNKAYSRVTRFTIVFSVMAALVLPIGYLFISYQNLLGILETEAEINSVLVSNLISNNPELWRYESLRLEELLDRRPRSGESETRRILDEQNTLVAASFNDLPAPHVTATQTISDDGVVVGRIEISRSLLPILLRSGLLAVFGLGLGLMLYRLMPFQEIAKAGIKLQENNAFLKKVMEGSTNSLVVLDPAGFIQMFNRRFEALSGCSSEKLLGRPLCRMFSGDARLQIEAELGQVSVERAEHVTFETVLSRQDGQVLNLFCGVVPLLSEGAVSGIVVSLDDITDRVTAEEERLREERHYQQTQKLESLGVLAGGIAHEFNNILSIIMGYSFVLKEELKPLSSQADHVAKIEEAASRASLLCRQMQSYAGKNELQHSPVNLHAQVEELVKMLHSGIKKNVSIELDLVDEQVIIADCSQIQQVIVNLIINAAEAIGDNSGTVGISLRKTEILPDQICSDFAGNPVPAGSYVCLKVVDNGCGMNEETQKRVFEPFYTTKFTGRGLGMFATLGIIRSHGGILQLSSKPGIGTAFKVYLPLTGEAATPDPKPAVDTAPVAEITGTILLVDDEANLRIIGTTLLERIGFSTISAADGLEALTLYRERPDKIDLVLLDLLMPKMGGIETYHRLRQDSRTIPVIFCSGCDREEISADILADEHVRFLKKPYLLDQLRSIVIEMLTIAAIPVDGPDRDHVPATPGGSFPPQASMSIPDQKPA